MRTGLIGAAGTIAAVELPRLSAWAACAAGFGTGAWMLCQIGLAVWDRIEQRRNRKP